MSAKKSTKHKHCKTTTSTLQNTRRKTIRARRHGFDRRKGGGGLQRHVAGEQEREEEFVFLEQGATDVRVERVRKVVGQIAQTTIQNLRFVAVQIQDAQNTTSEADFS